MPLAFSYIRFSSDKQGDGTSVERQDELAARYAAEHGLTLDSHTYRDLGISAFKSKNRDEGALGAFIQAVDGGKIPAGAYLLAESFDRISRDFIDIALELLLNLTRKGIIVVILKKDGGGDVYSTTTIRADRTKLILALFEMARSNEESVIKSQRISASYKLRAQRGEIPFNKGPSWLRRVDKRTLEVVPEKAAIINRIFDEAIKGYGSRIIARNLHREKVPTLQWAKEWNQALVSGLLRSPQVYGAWKDNESLLPPIMSKEKFLTAVAAVQGRKWKGGRAYGVPNIFAGLAFCAHCGSRVRYIPSSDGRPHIKCKNAVDKWECKAKNYPYNACEAALIYDLVRRAGFDLSYENATTSEAPALTVEIEMLKRQQAKLIEWALATEGVKAIPEKLNSIQRKITELEGRLGAVTAPVITDAEVQAHRDLLDRYAKMMDKGLRDAEPSRDEVNVMRREVRTALQRLVKRIEFGVGIKRWEPTLFVTLVDGSRMPVGVTGWLSPSSLLAHKKSMVPKEADILVGP